jgi:large subunit ribosomal protein L19
MDRVKKEIRPGDQVRVERRVIEGEKERIQIIEGIVIARKHGNEPGATITVRKIASGVGVEFVFPLKSPQIKKIEIVKNSKVNRAKLYYLRKRFGKASRMKESKNVSSSRISKKNQTEKK